MDNADDIKLLCPRVNGLQSMNNVCENFADEHVMCNARKHHIFVADLIESVKTTSI